MKKIIFALLALAFCLGGTPCLAQRPNAKNVVKIIDKVNRHWQETHPKHERAFWDNAAYHTGNMEAFFLTGNRDYYNYSEAWAKHNEWRMF